MSLVGNGDGEGCVAIWQQVVEVTGIPSGLKAHCSCHNWQNQNENENDMRFQNGFQNIFQNGCQNDHCDTPYCSIN